MDENLNSKTFDIDFHVHTPASSCYNKNGKTEDEAYREFLFKTKMSGLKVVCITDHNTINGYKKLLDIRNDIEKQLGLYDKMASSIGEMPNNLALEVESLKEISEIFRSVSFFPGVEFTTQEQIHMLVIFNNNINLDIINQFLYSGGYGPENQGKDQTEILAKWTVFDLFDEVNHFFKEDAIVIAAHVDREKGIWESLEKSLYKANIFRSSKLTGITYNSPSTKDAIKQVYKNKEYKRLDSSIPAFFQCSDFHNEQEQKIGTPRAYIKMNSISFVNIVKAFSNPNEYIFSPAPPKTMKIIEELTNNINSITIPSLDSSYVDEIKKAICAFSNTNSGNIIIGLNELKEPIGIHNTEGEIVEIIKDICEGVTPSPDADIQVYEYGKRKIISIRVNKGMASLYWCGDSIYILKENTISIARPNDISAYVETKIFDRYKNILIINRQRLQKIQDMIYSYSDGLEVMQFLNIIENNTKYLMDVVKLKIAKFPEEPLTEQIKLECVSDGNIIALDKINPRAKETVCRFSAPIYKLSDDVINNLSCPKFYGEKVIISNGGAVHYDSLDCIKILPHGRKALVLSITEDSSNISAKFLAAYLKSNVLLYYSYVCKDTFNIYLPECYNILRVPKRITMDQRIKIEELVDEILKYEKSYLNKATEICQNCKEHSENICCPKLKSIQDTHNNTVAEIMSNIDNQIYSVLELDDDTINYIEKKLYTLLPQKLI